MMLLLVVSFNEIGYWSLKCLSYKTGFLRLKKLIQYDVKILYTQYFGWPYQLSSGVQMDGRYK